jgi:hypothetical protein
MNIPGLSLSLPELPELPLAVALVLVAGALKLGLRSAIYWARAARRALAARRSSS